jgi:hypothetical protein
MTRSLRFSTPLPRHYCVHCLLEVPKGHLSHTHCVARLRGQRDREAQRALGQLVGESVGNFLVTLTDASVLPPDATVPASFTSVSAAGFSPKDFP